MFAPAAMLVQGSNTCSTVSPSAGKFLLLICANPISTLSPRPTAATAAATATALDAKAIDFLVVLLLTTQGWPPDSCFTTAAMVTGSTAGAHIIKSSSTAPPVTQIWSR